MNILFVCTGNTCRSPMAEGYLKSLNIDDIEVKSRGLFANGDIVSKNSVLALEEIGVDISAHVSKQISEEDISWADRVYCMSQGHKDFLSSYAKEKVFLLGEGISDPFGGNLDCYRKCFDEIKRNIDNIFKPYSIIKIDYPHIKQVAKLEKICFSQPWSEQAILEAFENRTKFFVCEKDGKVLGYIGISCVIDEGYITNVAVFPEYRNLGIGTALLEKTFDLARELSLSFVSLEVRESNYKAISLYEKLGFEKEGLRKNFYENPKENALIMTKRF